MKPLPPYARSARIVADTTWIRCGQRGWQFMRQNPECGELVWPANQLADELDWGGVAGTHAYVVRGDVPNASARMLVSELLSNGAETVCVIDWDLYESGRTGAVTFERDDG